MNFVSLPGPKNPLGGSQGLASSPSQETWREEPASELVRNMFRPIDRQVRKGRTKGKETSRKQNSKETSDQSEQYKLQIYHI